MSQTGRVFHFSKTISKASHDNKENKLYIEFRNGAQQVFHDVPRSEFELLERFDPELAIERFFRNTYRWEETHKSLRAEE